MIDNAFKKEKYKNGGFLTNFNLNLDTEFKLY